MTKIKLWISDIDGTLMNYDSSYTKELENVIKKVKEKGVKIVLATGRMYMGANFVQKKFDLDTPVVCYQGAIVRDKDKVLYQEPVDINLAKEIISYLRQKNIHTHVYNDDVLYIEDDNKRIMQDYCGGRGTVYTVLNSLDEIKFNQVAKILAVIEDAKLMQEVKKELSEKYKGILGIVQSATAYLEITNINASKGNALNFLKNYWGLKDEEILASGDQDNDIDLLKNAGIKISVGEKSKGLLEVANYHAKSVNSNELVKYVEEFILCE